MKYSYTQKLQQMLPFMCCCGQQYHGENPQNRYLFPTISGEVCQMSGGGTVGEMYSYFPSETEEALDFMINQARVCPDQTCFEILSQLADIGDEEEKEVSSTFLMTIVEEMKAITSLTDFEWEKLKKDVKEIVVVTEDKRIEETMINKPGICQCGCKHSLNGVEYDVVLLVNDQLVGLTFSDLFIPLLVQICEECSIEMWRIMKLYVEIENALYRMSENDHITYFHGGNGYGDFYHRVLSDSYVFNELGKPYGFTKRNIFHRHFVFLLEKHRKEKKTIDEMFEKMMKSQQKSQYSDDLCLPQIVRNGKCSCGKEGHFFRKYEGLWSVNEDGIMFHLPLDKSLGLMKTQLPISDTTLNYLKNLHRIFPEETCPNVLMSFALSYGEENDETLSFIESINKEYAMITNMSDEEYEELVKTLPPIEMKIDDRRIQRTIMIQKKGICQCGHKHSLNGIEYDTVILVNDQLVGIDFFMPLKDLLRDICIQCHIPLHRFFYVFLEYYQLFITFATMDVQEKQTFFHGGVDISYTPTQSIDSREIDPMQTETLLQFISEENYEQYISFNRYYSFFKRYYIECHPEMNQQFVSFDHLTPKQKEYLEEVRMMMKANDINGDVKVIMKDEHGNIIEGKIDLDTSGEIEFNDKGRIVEVDEDGNEIGMQSFGKEMKEVKEVKETKETKEVKRERKQKRMEEETNENDDILEGFDEYLDEMK